MGYETQKPNIKEDSQVHIDFAQTAFEMRRKKAAKDAGILDETSIKWNKEENQWEDKNGIPLDKIKELYSDNDNSSIFK